MQSLLTNINQEIGTSYIFPLSIYKQKISQNKTLNSNQNLINNQNQHFNLKSTSKIQPKIPLSNSLKNIQKEVNKENISNKSKNTLKLPPVQQSRGSTISSKPNQKSLSIIKSISNKKQLENKLQSKDIYIAFQQEKQQIIKKYQSNPAQKKYWQTPNQLNNQKNYSKKTLQSLRQSFSQTQKNLEQKNDRQISINEIMNTQTIKPQRKNRLQILKNCQKIISQQNKNNHSESIKKINDFRHLSQMQSLKKINSINYDLALQELNISNGVFFQPSNKKILVFIGKGNNKPLVQQIFKKRAHFQVTKNIKQANIVWLQKSQDDYFHCQEFISSRQKTYKQCLKQKLISKKLICSQDTLPKLIQKSHLFLEEDVNKIINFYTKNQKTVFQSNILMPIIQNHVPGHRQISDKKNLYINMKKFCKQKNIQMVNFLPKTFLINKELNQLEQHIKNYPNKNMWIIKPSENSNQGKGISIAVNNQQLYDTIYNCDIKGESLIIQQYLSNCLLYNNRKFDIRAYILITNLGIPKCYWYNDGYIRTSGHKFDINSHSEYVHLTNDAIQCSSSDYGKYQNCNKISYSTLQRYIQINYPLEKNFIQKINQQMKKIVQIIMQANLKKLVQSSIFNYQIFGLDFMIDNNFKVYLIEVNTNPSLQTHCPLLERVIPTMLQQAYRIAVDPVFKSSFNSDQNRNFQKGKFQQLQNIQTMRNFEIYQT